MNRRGFIGWCSAALASVSLPLKLLPPEKKVATAPELITCSPPNRFVTNGFGYRLPTGAGYATGCAFHVNDKTYVNIGTSRSCDFRRLTT